MHSWTRICWSLYQRVLRDAFVEVQLLGCSIKSLEYLVSGIIEVLAEKWPKVKVNVVGAWIDRLQVLQINTKLCDIGRLAVVLIVALTLNEKVIASSQPDVCLYT